ncbi:RF14 [Retroperitoneal fibromatosis-associated herpesvirus]|uniref:RF14 n=1 Tax=Retroperitoneal fibromatosis-associated herpesvirus TaxID=111469 RepID=U5NJ05_9GAMA|nr:RF14 [Retroperitoneal fibromatosis-associated herpesvirus]AGY30761.1 RF14 [Retroperitoneal fibromatosis-associated herpesvirus]
MTDPVVMATWTAVKHDWRMFLLHREIPAVLLHSEYWKIFFAPLNTILGGRVGCQLAIYIFCIVGFAYGAEAGRLMGPLGGSASLTCQTPTEAEVLTVTWQKSGRESPENMATFSGSHGVVVQPGFLGKANITTSNPHNSTLTLYNLTAADEGCYICLFNTFGSGAKSCRVCLDVTAPPGGRIQVHTLYDGINVTCLAVGRPAPSLSWTGPGRNHSADEGCAPQANGTTLVWSTLFLPTARVDALLDFQCLIKSEGLTVALPVVLDADRASYNPAEEVTVICAFIALIVFYGVVWALYHFG